MYIDFMMKSVIFICIHVIYIWKHATPALPLPLHIPSCIPHPSPHWLYTRAYPAGEHVIISHLHFGIEMVQMYSSKLKKLLWICSLKCCFLFINLKPANQTFSLNWCDKRSVTVMVHVQNLGIFSVLWFVLEVSSQSTCAGIFGGKMIRLWAVT